MPAPDLLFWRLTALLGLAGFLSLALFVAAPGVDLWAAGLFFDGEGFPLREDPRLNAVRRAYEAVFWVVFVCVSLGLAARLVAGRDARTPIRAWLFLAALFAVGPGLLANALFKAHWGRARPHVVDAFGGAHPYTPPFAFSDACAANCSFVSGEGAAAAAVGFGLLAVFWPRLRAGWARGAATAALALWLLGAALVRMAPGKHFLSDVVFSVVLVGLAAALFYRVAGVAEARRDFSIRAAWRDVGAAARRVRAAAPSDAGTRLGMRAVAAAGDRHETVDET